MNSKKVHPLITGTIILTITGLLTRLIGFYYRIYLTKLFGDEGMGIYQLLSPVLAISFSLTAAGFQTAISKFVAEGNCSTNKKSPFVTVIVAMSICVPLSLLCNAIIYYCSEFIAANILLEPRTAPMLRILSFSIPPSAIHACINGYFYGTKRTFTPSVTQLIEQLTRVGCVFFVTASCAEKNMAPTISVAVLGLLIGELFSMLVSFITIAPFYKRDGLDRKIYKKDYFNLLSMALPLTANRITLNLLQSIETVSIPAKLRLYGYDNSQALSVYGVLTGMAMPLIFFPNALTGSIAVLLLPTVSETKSEGREDVLKKLIHQTFKYCGAMGLFFGSFFIICGNYLGLLMFKSELAGHFIQTLGFLCPFMYLGSTLSSVLQGLGKAGSLFLINSLCLLFRLLFIFIFVPKVGIAGYLWGMISSQILSTLSYIILIKKTVH